MSDKIDVDFKDQSALILFTYNQLKDSVWLGIDLSNIIIKELRHGHIYKLHSKKEWAQPVVIQNLLNNSHILNVAVEIGNFDIAPKVLASGPDWHISEFAGENFGSLNRNKEYVMRMGKLIARLHQIPTDWFEKYQLGFKEKYPVLEKIPNQNFIWPIISKGICCAYRLPEDIEKICVVLPDPLSKAGKRTVIVHGDLFCDNACVDVENKSRIIDFEFTCICYAAHDFCHLMADSWGLNSLLEARKLLAKSYLEELGEETSEEAIELLIFDGLVAEHVHFYVLRSIWWGVFFDIDLGVSHLEKLRLIIEVVRENRGLMQYIIKQNYNIRERSRDKQDDNKWPWWSLERLEYEMNIRANT